jgi:hypothetical protein
MRHFYHCLAVVVFVLAATLPGCNCQHTCSGRTCVNNGDGGNQNGDGFTQVGTLDVSPADVTLDLQSGGPPATQAFTVTYQGNDVTAFSTFALADMTLGIMNLNTFTSSTDHGGSTSLLVNYTPMGGTLQSGQAMIHLKVHGAFGMCPGCPSFPTGPTTGPMTPPTCSSLMPATVVYPPDGVLLPPNLNQLEIQFNPSMGANAYEVDFENPNTDVRVVTKCIATSDTRGVPSNGCQLDLDNATWDFIAKSNKGGAPIQIIVRATTDGTCATISGNTPAMAIAEQDVSGGVYYWKSTVTASGTGGQIWRKEFGDTTPEEVITATTGSGFSATCYGCHFLSRDGQRMSVNLDDSDSDDEYGDVSSGLVDVGAKMFLTEVGYVDGQAAGFQAFSHDHAFYLGTSGDGSGTPSTAGGGGGASNVFFLWNGNATAPGLTPVGTITVGKSGDRPTQPDWSADDKSVVFVIPIKAGGGSYQDDSHVFGGSLWTMPYMGAGKFGTATELLHSSGENNYYPSFSPDGTFIVFNRVPLTGSVNAIDTCTGQSCPNDSFSNPAARVFVLPTGTGATPIDAENLNGSKASNPVPVSNSWPRWSPFIQTYKGSKLLWVTFSSTRDYGLRVRNHVQVNGQSQVQCYPPDEVHDPNGSHGQQFPDNCQQPQIWMAAINLSSAEVGNQGDPSFPAFWLPFQDITTHNHSAQWTSTVVTMPTPDGGTCIQAGQDCTHDPNGCCGTLACTANGTCGIL